MIQDSLSSLGLDVRRDAIEIEDGCFGRLLIDFEPSSLERGDALERPSSPKTLEAIDEY